MLTRFLVEADDDEEVEMYGDWCDYGLTHRTISLVSRRAIKQFKDLKKEGGMPVSTLREMIASNVVDDLDAEDLGLTDEAFDAIPGDFWDKIYDAVERIL